MTATELILTKNSQINNGWIDYRSGTGKYVLFTTAGRDSVDAWVEYLTNNSRLIATEPQTTEIGGQPATTIDVRNADESVDLFIYAPAPGVGATWGIPEGGVDRIHLVEVDGVTIAILIEAPEEDFDEFATAVDAALATLEWNPEG